MSLNITTIVPHVENLELRKDTGQLPYHLNRVENVNATLVTYYYTLNGGRDEGPVVSPPAHQADHYLDYPFWLTEVKGLNIEFLPYQGRGKFYEKAILKYIWSHSKDIDVLNLFHYNAENIFYSLVYKLRNPTGKVYLKLDIDISFYETQTYFFNKRGKLGWIKAFIFLNLIQPFFFRIVHTISAESLKGLKYFQSRFNVSSKKMMLVPNAVDEMRIKYHINNKKGYSEKENLIITVGRIGTAQKNNEMLLNAIAKADLRDWKVFFVGDINPSFYSAIDKFYQNNPTKRYSVKFTGHVGDAKELYNIYDKAKIFCLTSRDEGFPLSACEAAYFGNYLILTDKIDCFDELTHNGNYGISVPLDDDTTLANEVTRLINSEVLLGNMCEYIKKHADEKLTWQTITPRLYNRLVS